jgi:HPt (histidine-containing phosphotransfer) domain-containing protein
MKDLPLVDLAQIDRLNEWGGADLKRKMIDLFLTHAMERLDQVRDGIATGSSKKAENGAHTLKSSAGNVGASRVQKLAQDAETLAEEGKLDELSALFPSLEEEFHAACEALKDVREGVDR